MKEPTQSQKILIIFILVAISTSVLVSFIVAEIMVSSSDDGPKFDNKPEVEESIPDESDYVIRYDVEKMSNDLTTDDIISVTSGDFAPSAGTDSESVLNKIFQNIPNSSSQSTDIGINRFKVGKATLFGRGDNYRAVIVEVESSITEVSKFVYGDRKSESYRYKQRKVNDLNGGGFVGRAKQDYFVVGNESAVKDSLSIIEDGEGSISSPKIPKLDGEFQAKLVVYDYERFIEDDKYSNIGDVENLMIRYRTNVKDGIIVDIIKDARVINSEHSVNRTVDTLNKTLETEEILGNDSNIRVASEPSNIEIIYEKISSIVPVS